MGLPNLFKGKRKDTEKPIQTEPDPNELSDPGQPTADTADLVSVIAIDDPFLITREGAFLLMLEIPEIDMDIYGQTEAELSERYQMALGALPPGTKFQMTVLEEPFDPTDDVRYFSDRSSYFQNEIEYMDPTSESYPDLRYLCELYPTCFHRFDGSVFCLGIPDDPLPSVVCFQTDMVLSAPIFYRLPTVPALSDPDPPLRHL